VINAPSGTPIKPKADNKPCSLGAAKFALVLLIVVSGFLVISTWRVLFVILGLLGLVWIIIWYKVFTDYPEDNKHVSQEEIESFSCALCSVSTGFSP
jgi:membrane-bound ClpP family serine protease